MLHFGEDYGVPQARPTIESLRGKSPDDIYTADCIAQGMTVDKCALYSYRLAVYYADHNGELPPNKQNWWNWKEK